MSELGDSQFLDEDIPQAQPAQVLDYARITFDPRIITLAKRYTWMLNAVAAALVLTAIKVAMGFYAVGRMKGGAPAMPIHPSILMVLGLVGFVVGILLLVRMCMVTASLSGHWAWGVAAFVGYLVLGAFIPFLILLVLIILAIAARRRLNAAGVRMGFFGVSRAEIDRLKVQTMRQTAD